MLILFRALLSKSGSILHVGRDFFPILLYNPMLVQLCGEWRSYASLFWAGADPEGGAVLQLQPLLDWYAQWESQGAF